LAQAAVPPWFAVLRFAGSSAMELGGEGS